jgi:hypothetical protein
MHATCPVHLILLGFIAVITSDAAPLQLPVTAYVTYRGTSVSIVAGLQAGRSGFYSRQGRPDRFWGPPSLLSNWYRGEMAGA